MGKKRKFDDINSEGKGQEEEQDSEFETSHDGSNDKHRKVQILSQEDLFQYTKNTESRFGAQTCEYIDKLNQDEKTTKNLKKEAGILLRFIRDLYTKERFTSGEKTPEEYELLRLSFQEDIKIIRTGLFEKYMKDYDPKGTREKLTRYIEQYMGKNLDLSDFEISDIEKVTALLKKGAINFAQYPWIVHKGRLVSECISQEKIEEEKPEVFNNSQLYKDPIYGSIDHRSKYFKVSEEAKNFFEFYRKLIYGYLKKKNGNVTFKEGEQIKKDVVEDLDIARAHFTKITSETAPSIKKSIEKYQKDFFNLDKWYNNDIEDIQKDAKKEKLKLSDYPWVHFEGASIPDPSSTLEIDHIKKRKNAKRDPNAILDCQILSKIRLTRKYEEDHLDKLAARVKDKIDQNFLENGKRLINFIYSLIENHLKKVDLSSKEEGYEIARKVNADINVIYARLANPYIRSLEPFEQKRIHERANKIIDTSFYGDRETIDKIAKKCDVTLPDWMEVPLMPLQKFNQAIDLALEGAQLNKNLKNFLKALVDNKIRIYKRSQEKKGVSEISQDFLDKLFKIADKDFKKIDKNFLDPASAQKWYIANYGSPSQILELVTKYNQLSLMLEQWISFKRTEKYVGEVPDGYTNVDDDGYCFYHSIIHALGENNVRNIILRDGEIELTGALHIDLRNFVLSHIHSNAEFYIEAFPDRITAQMDSTSPSYMWADEMMVPATARALGVNIEVTLLDAGGNPRNDRSSGNGLQIYEASDIQQEALAASTVRIANLGDVHFVPAIEQQLNVTSILLPVVKNNDDEPDTGMSIDNGGTNAAMEVVADEWPEHLVSGSISVNPQSDRTDSNLQVSIVGELSLPSITIDISIKAIT